MADADKLNEKRQKLAQAAAKGGRARADKLSSAERTEGARKAARARWAPRATEGQPLPKAEYVDRPLQIGDMVLDCAVLDDGRRVLSERGFTAAVGGKRGGSHWRRLDSGGLARKNYLPVFMSAANLQPFVQPSLAQALSQPIVYRTKSGGTGYGILATLVPEICEVWLKARQGKALLPSQEHLADRAGILLAGLAQVGIVALVDEATGYQEVRDRLELNRILDAYISNELLRWTKRFPDEYYRQLFRLRGWEYSPPSPKRPKLVGKLTNQIVYEKLPPGVLDELRKVNPIVRGGWRRYKHHQYLTEDIGNPHLEKHLAAVTTLMRVSSTWTRFQNLLNKAFPQKGMQYMMSLEFNEDDELEDN